MDSVKTKSDKYTLIGDKAIAGVVLVPAGKYLTAYVAWEWENQAKQKFFAIIKTDVLVDLSLTVLINHVADYGTDVTHDPEARKLFPLLF